jgi:hypothetical protein
MSEANDTGQTPISHTRTLDELAEFWDTHSLADSWDATQDAEFAVRAEHRHRVTLDPEVYARIAALAQRRGLAPETLVNLWLLERLQQAG